AVLEPPPGALRVEPRLYLAAPATILDVIQQQDDAHASMIVFGHNLGFTELPRISTIRRTARAADRSTRRFVREASVAAYCRRNGSVERARRKPPPLSQLAPPIRRPRDFGYAA